MRRLHGKILVSLLAFVMLTAPVRASEAPTAGPRPESTVILAGRTEARFSRDFSPLLKQLRLAWIIAEDGIVPTEIEPSEELGDKYLTDTNTYATSFKNSSAADLPDEDPPPSDEFTYCYLRVEYAEELISTGLRDAELRTDASYLYEDVVKHCQSDEPVIRRLRARAHLGLGLIQSVDVFKQLSRLLSTIGLDLSNLGSLAPAAQ